MSEQFMPNKLAKAGEIIFQQGDAPDEGIYFICSGEVAVSRTENGKTRELAKLGEGDVFGEMGIINRAPRNATVTALTDCGFFTLTQQKFQHRVNQLDPVIRGAFRVFVLSIRDLNAQRDELASQLQQWAQYLHTNPPAATVPAEEGAPAAPEGLASGKARKLSY